MIPEIMVKVAMPTPSAMDSWYGLRPLRFVTVVSEVGFVVFMRNLR